MGTKDKKAHKLFIAWCLTPCGLRSGAKSIKIKKKIILRIEPSPQITNFLGLSVVKQKLCKSKANSKMFFSFPENLTLKLEAQF